MSPARQRGTDAFWDIDFSTRYHNQLTAFWNTHGNDFRTLAKCTFLSRAVQALELKQLTDSDFQCIVGALIGPVTWPVTLAMMQSSHTVDGDVRAFDISGHVATNLLRVVAPLAGRSSICPVKSWHSSSGKRRRTCTGGCSNR